MAKALKKYFVYILECSNGSYYTGYTVDMAMRYQKHLDGAASKYTRSFPPRKIAACWAVEAESSSLARRIEYGIKQLSTNKKIDLIQSQGKILTLVNQQDRAQIKVVDRFQG